MKKTYDKLVRDRVPEIIEEAGKKAQVCQVDPERLRHYAFKKLREEIEEFIENPCAEEAADGAPIVALTVARDHIFALAGGESPRLLAAPLGGDEASPWQHVSLGDGGREVRDLHATEDALHVVGLEPGIDEDGPETEALIWYLPF